MFFFATTRAAMAAGLLIAGVTTAAAQQDTMTEPRQLTTAEPVTSMAAPGEMGVADMATQSVAEAGVAAFALGEPGAADLFGRGFTYSHDWGDRRGQWILNLNWGAVRRNSRVFASAGECAPGGGKFIGAARYTVHNVAQTNGRVSIWLNVEWREPIRVCVDYFVVNP